MQKVAPYLNFYIFWRLTMLNKGVKPTAVWWRNVQAGEFYNIEREPRLKGGGGSLYIEIPKSMVRQTLEFLGKDIDTLQNNTSPIKIKAKVLEDPSREEYIEFHTKNAGRMRIARQNRKQKNSLRHPAWSSAYGFPEAPEGLPNVKDAYMDYFPKGGLRIYIIKASDGTYYAGYTSGPRPEGLEENNPNLFLYPTTNEPGGLIKLSEEN